MKSDHPKTQIHTHTLSLSLPLYLFLSFFLAPFHSPFFSSQSMKKWWWNNDSGIMPFLVQSWSSISSSSFLSFFLSPSFFPPSNSNLFWKFSKEWLNFYPPPLPFFFSDWIDQFTEYSPWKSWLGRFFDSTSQSFNGGNPINPLLLYFLASLRFFQIYVADSMHPWPRDLLSWINPFHTIRRILFREKRILRERSQSES